MTTPTVNATMAGRQGFAVVTVLFLSVVLASLLGAMVSLTNIELSSSRVNADMTSGFYAAEAGLNVRGEEIRREFQGYRRPAGDAPPDGDCSQGNGSGDFACAALEINHRTVTTYVVEDARNDDPDDAERTITVPPGELFAGLSAIQYRYSVFSEAVPEGHDRPEALLEMVFRVRLVPLFQFAAFYDKDLEILPGPTMTLDGRVHANGDLYLGSGATLRINGQVTSAVRSDGSGGNVHRGRKDRSQCEGTVRVETLVSGDAPVLACAGSSYHPLPESAFDPFRGQIRTKLDTLTVPPPEEFGVDGLYWREADVRIGLDLRHGASQARVVVLRPQAPGGIPQIDELLTADLATCPAVEPDRFFGVREGSDLPVLAAEVAAVEYSDTMRDNREQRSSAHHRTSYRQLLEVDVAGLLDCLHANRSSFFATHAHGENGIDSRRNGGLVWYLTVLGPHAGNASSGYGVRLRNADVLAASDASAPSIRGLTVVSDQAVFTHGHVNRAAASWRPAAIIADTIHVLSQAWDDARSTQNVSQRGASDTTVNAAFLAGTDTTGSRDGTDGQGGAYNGGLENYPRLHEDWSGRTLRYNGSFVSLGEPRRSTGAWRYGDPIYTAPNRDWNYDVRFDDAANLPPLTPRFVYLVQERFIRSFDR